MRKPWQIWLSFGVAVMVVVVAMAWLSVVVLRLDRNSIEARRRAQFEENVRLALWRMDSSASALIAQQASIEPDVYLEANGRMLLQERDEDRYEELPAARVISFNFEVDERNRLETNPKLPLAVTGAVTSGDVLNGPTRVPETPVEPVEPVAQGLKWRGWPRPLLYKEVDAVLGKLAQSQQVQQSKQNSMTDLYAQTQAGHKSEPSQSAEQGVNYSDLPGSQMERSEQEYFYRANTVWTSNNFADGLQLAADSWAGTGAMQAVWIEDTLVLARRVARGDHNAVQGAVLDWAALREWLLGDVRENGLPGAALSPVRSDEEADPTRSLATLPVMILPGDVPALGYTVSHTVSIMLVTAWASALLAACAVALLLGGTVSLSERRGAFVSAVTHELRTPLTTFRMYTEMLHEDMVEDEEARRGYIATLRREADRLGHLVENVLSYARLERTDPLKRAEEREVGELLDRVVMRLSERCRQAGMELVVRMHKEVRDRCVRVDRTVFEQVLFNLVDNACKYAAGAEDRRVELVALDRGDVVQLRVCDHGPGVAEEDRYRIFKAFRKSAHQAAQTAPGVGLGLALSRRMARNMGGDLALSQKFPDGACFVFTLPGC